MPDGKEMGRAYVTVNLDDHTDDDYARLKSNLESKGDITLGTKLKAPDAGDYDRIKALTEAKGDISLKTKLDTTDAQKSFRDLESTIDTSSKKSSSSIGQFVTSTAGAWTALGAVLAGPAVALSLGVVAGGFAAIGIEAEKSQPQVTAAFNTMKATGTDVLQQSFQSLTPVIAGSVGTWTSAIRTMGPSFLQISGEIGPGLRIINDAIVQSAQQSIPAMASALSQATPLAHSLAGGIGDVSNGFDQFLGHLDFSQADSGLSALLRDVGQLETTVGSVVNAVMPLGNSILSSVIPPVLTLVNDLSNGLAPALRGIGSAVSAIMPVLNFASGPNDSILVMAVSAKLLGSAVSAALPVFNSMSTGATNAANKLLGMAGASDKSVSSFTLMTDAQKKAAVAAAAAGLASATAASETAAANVATLESAAAADAASVSQEQLAAARTAATIAAEAETAATDAVNAASSATSFALGPVGIGLGVVAGLMTLFGGSTDKATPPVQNFTAQLDKLATSAPDAAKGILASDPALADLVNRAHDAGISVQQLSAALDQGGAAQKQVQDALNGTASALGAQTTSWSGVTEGASHGTQAVGQQAISIKDLNDKVTGNKAAFDALTPTQQNLINQYRNATGVIGALTPMFGQNAEAAKAAANTGASAATLTAEQQTAAAGVAKQYGLSVNSVVAAFETLPGAGSTAAGAVDQVASAFMTGENAALNSEQAAKDYFAQLASNAATANNAASNANHSYQQSVQSVSDAEHGAAQAAQGVVTARRAVVDATNSAAQSELSYEASQRAVADANAGVTAAERTLAQAQVSATQAQVAETQARKDAVENLKSLSLQLADQTASEQAAEIKLFDATRTAAGQGITSGNTQSILDAPLSTSNEAQKKAALDLVTAQNALADSTDQTAQLRDKVNIANQQGVNGNPAVVSAVAALANAQQQVASAQTGVVKANQAVSDAVNAENQALYNLGKAQQAIVDAQKGVSDALYNQQKAHLAIKDAVYSEHQALLSLNDAQAAAKKANDLNTTSLDLTTQAGRNNWAQLQTIFTSIPAWVTGISRYKQMVDDTATAFGGSKQAAYDFLVQQGKIPPVFTYDMVAVAKVDSSSWAAAVSSVANTQGQAAKLNMLSHMADGGPVKGPGGPRSDVIPAMLSNNEYVQPADVVEHYGVGYMDALRQKKVPRGGDGASLPGFASGGLVGYASDVAALGIEGAAYQINVDAQTSLGLPHPAALPAYVPPPASTSGGGGFTAGSGVAGSHAANRSIVMDIFGSQFGWSSPAEQSATDYLEMRESGYNNVAQNPTSTAYGMFQFLNSTWGGYGIPKTSDPTQQSIAGGRYINARYGDPIGAANHERAFNWFDNGGYMLNGPAINTTGKPEMILDPGMTNTMQQLNAAVQSSGHSAPSKAGATVNNSFVINAVEDNAHRIAASVCTEIAWAMRGA